MPAGPLERQSLGRTGSPPPSGGRCSRISGSRVPSRLLWSGTGSVTNLAHGFGFWDFEFCSLSRAVGVLGGFEGSSSDPRKQFDMSRTVRRHPLLFVVVAPTEPFTAGRRPPLARRSARLSEGSRRPFRLVPTWGRWGPLPQESHHNKRPAESRNQASEAGI